MISGVAFAFVLLPCIGACVLGALVSDWRLVAAAACGAFGLVAISPYMSEPVRLISLPGLMGVVLGASVLGPRLYFRPTSDIWSRMLWAVVPTFVITFLFLITNVNGA